ncbi:hypothetical protein D3C83_115760 [compost metagenome]
MTSDATTAYVVFTNGVLGAFDLTTGALRWYRKAPVGRFRGSAIISQDTLFLGGHEAGYAISSR